jgi:hypothetical protein
MTYLSRLIAVAFLCLQTLPTLGQALQTPHGKISVNVDHELLYRGDPFQPPVQGRGFLKVVASFSIDSKVVLVVEDGWGTMCPSRFHFVEISTAIAKATEAFGSCSDKPKIVQSGKIVSVSMPGHMEAINGYPARERAAAKEVHRFVYDSGSVTKERKVIPWKSYSNPKN